MQRSQVEANTSLSFEEARTLAVKTAGEQLQDPMVLSWLNRRTGQHSPPVDCCREEGKESWEIYAESRGGSVRVEIGDQYVFILREGMETDITSER